MKKLISSIVMLVLSLFVLIFDVLTEPTLEVIIASGLLVISSLIWLVMDARSLKNK